MYVKFDDHLKTFVLNEISLVIHNDSLILNLRIFVANQMRRDIRFDQIVAVRVIVHRTLSYTIVINLS